MKTVLKTVVLAIMVIATTQIYGQVGVGVNNPAPNDTLDVLGTAKISRYLKVGNPIAPPTQTMNYTKILELDPNTGFGGWDYVNVCGGTGWLLGYSATNRNYYSYTFPASRAVTRLISTWVWVPSGSTSPYISMQFTRSFGDNTFDGIFLEYTSNGTTWNLLTPVTTGYGATTGTSSSNCAVNYNGQAWSSTLTNVITEFTPTAATFAGKWVQFGITAISDASANGSIVNIFGFSFEVVPPSGLLNNTFQNGSIYAEKNVYAGSNVLMGDMAEYFKVDGNKVEAGDLVSLNTEIADSYLKTNMRNDPNVIGIVSTDPTITLNSPKGSPVALAGRVPVKVTTENGLIKIGDYLTASSLSGYAMKANSGDYCIGKAIQTFNGKTGKILCLIQNGWFNNIVYPKQISTASGIKNKKKDISKEVPVFTQLLEATKRNLQVPPVPSDPNKFWKWDGEKLTEFIPQVKNESK